MIILDTNVCSELLVPAPDAAVIEWLSGLTEIPKTTVITRAELLSGVAVLPEGKRKQTLYDGIRRILSSTGECLPLTPEAADEYAAIIATRQRMGRPISGFDALIAAIARVNQATLATRNTKDFQHLDLDLINPWEV